MDFHAESLDLYHGCRSGRERERTAAFERLGQLLYRVAWSRVQHDPRVHGVAEEATQESLAIVWQHLAADQGPEPGSFIAWASAIVVNKVRENLRRLEPAARSRRTLRVALSRQVSLDAPTEPTGESLGDRLVGSDETAMDDTLAYREIHALVAEIHGLASLSEPSKMVLLKGYIEGLDDAELAARLGTSRGNVHVIRCRDLARLRSEPAFMARLRGLYGLD